MTALQSHTTSNAATLSQHAALAALTLPAEGDAAVAAMVGEFRRRRDAALALLRSASRGRDRAGRGLLSLHSNRRAQRAADPDPGTTFAARLLDEHDVAVVPGRAFQSPEWIRVSYAAPMERCRWRGCGGSWRRVYLTVRRRASMQQGDDSRVLLDTLGGAPQDRFRVHPPENRVNIAVQLEPAFRLPGQGEVHLGRRHRDPVSAGLASRHGCRACRGRLGWRERTGPGSFWMSEPAGSTVWRSPCGRTCVGFRHLNRREQIEDAHVLLPARQSQPDVASMEMSTQLTAEADPTHRNFHFRLGRAAPGAHRSTRP